MEFLKETNYNIEKHPLKDNIQKFRNYLNEFEKLNFESFSISELKNFFFEKLDLIVNDLFKLNLRIQCSIPKAGDNSKNHVYKEIMMYDDRDMIRLKYTSYFETMKHTILQIYFKIKNDIIDLVNSKINKVLDLKENSSKKEEDNNDKEIYFKNLKFTIFVMEYINFQTSEYCNLPNSKTITEYEFDNNEDIKFKFISNILTNEMEIKKVEIISNLIEIRQHIITKLHFLIKHLEINKLHFNDVIVNWQLESKDLYEKK